MPSNYNTGFKWAKDYLYGKTNIVGSIYQSNAPAILSPQFIQNTLLTNYPGISLDDIGVRIVNRRQEYSRWQDFPLPDVVTNLAQVALVEDFSTISTAVPALTNYFNTVRVEISSGTNLLLSTGDMRMADIHNRRFLIGTNSSGIFLWMNSYRTNATGTSSFGSYLTNAYLTIQSNS